MLSSIQSIHMYTDGVKKEEFLENKEKQDACIMQLQVIGELCSKLEKKFPDFSWFEYKKIIRMRHIISHDYFWIDTFEIRLAISQNITELEKAITQYIKTIK